MKPSEWDYLFPHFEPEEYLSPGGMALFKRNIIPFDPELLHNLEILRYSLNTDKHLFGLEREEEVTLTINAGHLNLRGYVTPEEFVTKRDKEPDQTFSYHLWCAADVSCLQVSAAIVFRYAQLFKFRGAILYPWGVHLDMRRGPKYLATREE